MTEQTVGWALHALEPDEELAVVEHLAECAECRRVADDVAGVTADLATALPQHEPPPGLRDAIVEQARHTPQVGASERPARGERPVPGDRYVPAPPGRHSVPARPATPGRRPSPSSGPSRPGGSDDGPPRSRSGPGRGSRRYGRLLVAAVAVVAVIVGGGAVYGQMQSLQAERDASLAQAQQMEQVLGQLAQPGTEHAFLREGEATVAAVMLHDGQRSVVPMGLSPNQVDEQTYVLWGLNGDEAPTAVGTFDVRTGAGGPVSVTSGNGETFAQYAVSLERGRTAPVAPSSVVAAGQVET